VHNEVLNATISFAAKALMVIGILKPQPIITEPVTTPPRGINAAYGEYLAWHASGCAECHTPRDPNTAQLDLTRPLAGGLIPFPEEGFTTTGSNITPCQTTGIGDWTERDFLTAMHTGMRPDGTIMLPFHPWPYFDKWSDEDLLAVWMYLRSLEPVTHQVPTSTLTGAAANATGFARGEALFGVYCAMCHGKDGSGGAFTTIELKDVAHEIADAALAQFIADGFPGSSRHSFGKTLTGDQITDLVAFIKNW
jgi:mono/diheme cytochrome c family protein